MVRVIYQRDDQQNETTTTKPTPLFNPVCVVKIREALLLTDRYKQPIRKAMKTKTIEQIDTNVVLIFL